MRSDSGHESELEAFRLAGEATAVETLGGRVDSVFFKMHPAVWGSVRARGVKSSLQQKLAQSHGDLPLEDDEAEAQVLRWLFAMDFARPLAAALYAWKTSGGTLEDWQSAELSAAADSLRHMAAYPEIRAAALLDAQSMVMERWEVITRVAEALLGRDPVHPLVEDSLSHEALVELLA